MSVNRSVLQGIDMGQSVKETLEVLVELQKAETEVVRIRAYLDEVEQEKKALEVQITSQQKVHDKKKGGLEILNSAIRDMEAEIQTIDERIKKSTAALKTATAKEYAPLQREVDNNVKRMDALELDLLGKMEEKEVRESEVTEDGKTLAQLTEKIRADQEAVEKKCADDRELLEHYLGRKAEIGGSLDPETLKMFDNICSTSAGLAVVEVKNGVCRGCFMNVPPQLYIEVQRGNDLILCPQCNRFLYFNNSED